MNRIPRMFELVQRVRAAKRPVLADELAEALEVSVRTIYRDIAALQAMRIPIEGAAGVGYVMRRGYDLPPLNFDAEEVEALRVGLMLLARTGDSALQKAADRISAKIDGLQGEDPWLQVAPWGAPVDDPQKGCISIAEVREAIRSSRKLKILYRDGAGQESERTIRPLALVYHLEANLIAAWCELRDGFRSFRTDRVWACEMLEEDFADQAEALRALWLEKNGY